MTDLKKNDELIVDIIDYGANGEGIAKVDGYTIFINRALKNEKCKIHITKVLKDYGFAKLVEVIESSKYRKESDCNTYVRCGGCALRHIDYEETLKIKQSKVQNLINKTLDNKVDVEETIGMEAPYFYRNKAIFPVSVDKKIGLYAERSHEIIPIDECKIQTLESQKIAKYIVDNWDKSIYDEKTNKGLLRNIVIRQGFKTDEIMVIIVQNGDDQYDVEKLVEEFPKIKTVILNINKKNTNVVMSNDNKVIYGDGFIYDFLGDYKFKISPNSFYQINPVQTEKLYNLAIDLAELKNDDVLCDLYCGIGTIGIFASKNVKKVYGIEIVEQAIENAKENSKINNIDNISFIQGDVEEAFDKLINEENIKPSAIIVDPPRKGLDNTTINNILKIKPEKLVYISCNPATMVRDIKSMEEIYRANKIIPVDMFPYTKHVECVVALKIR